MNCITESVTMGSFVASGKMLLSDRRRSLSEEYWEIMDAAVPNGCNHFYPKPQELTFTRSRPCKKNDQAYVEPKNWFVAQRIDNQTIKRYDPAKTPYQRVLERKDISLEAEARLAHIYVRLNPAELLPRSGERRG